MNSHFSRSRLQEILKSFPSLRIAVLGDFALDAYWFVDMAKAELSRETSLFNRPVVKESYSMGGSANVAWNLADLGVKQVSAFSALGNDWRGRLLKELMMKVGIHLQGCITPPDWSTVMFIKILLTVGDQQQEDARLDFINLEHLSQEWEASLLESLETCLPGLDALIVSDYQTVGVISPRMLKSLNALSTKYPKTLFIVDSRERIGQYKNMILKPNQLEAVRAGKKESDVKNFSEDDLISAGKYLQSQSTKPVFITLGERGCFMFEDNSRKCLPALKIPPPIDTVGAGDSFLAALTASLAAGASATEAAIIANLAAGVVIQKLNITGTASPGEIVRIFDDFYKDDIP
jgi:rfaE bifunctional protein kinase chain/domain